MRYLIFFWFYLVFKTVLADDVNIESLAEGIDFSCAELGGDGSYPFPRNCSKFITCVSGRAIIQECGPRTVFNPTKKVCDYPYRAGCEEEEIITEISHRECENWEFDCGNKCIHVRKICNDIKDCSNNRDELGCEESLNRFTLVPSVTLDYMLMIRLINFTRAGCAKHCLETDRFLCKSFTYNKRIPFDCALSGTNKGDHGNVRQDDSYEYYELPEYALNCTNLHECDRGKCIELAYVCDGKIDCAGDDSDERDCSNEALGYEIRLRGSDEVYEGRIEVKVRDKWGQVCDDKISMKEANVACRELGFPLGAEKITDKSQAFVEDLAEKDVSFQMDDVSCAGDETNLRFCKFAGWGINDCKADEVVGVVCKTPEVKCKADHYWQCHTGDHCIDIEDVCDGVSHCADNSDEGIQMCQSPTEFRLVNGTVKYEGRVEVRYRGRWGTICDNAFHYTTADVVCNSLGFKGEATVKRGAYFGKGTGPIWIWKVFCYGSEAKLLDCRMISWGHNNCDHSQDVGVICSS